MLGATSSPGAMAYQAGNLAGGSFNRLMATKGGKTRRDAFGKMVGGILPVGGAVIGAGLGLRVRAMNERAGTEVPMLRGRMAAGLSGGMGKGQDDALFMEMANSLGLNPGQTAALMEETAIGLGSGGLGEANTEGKGRHDKMGQRGLAMQLHRAHLSGASKGPLLAAARAQLPGGGALGASPSGAISMMLGAGRMMGLTGVRGDMSTAQFNAMTQARANQGLMTDVRGSAGTLAFATGLHGLGKAGSHATKGLGAVRTTGKVMGQGLGAAQSFGSMFSGMSKAAIWGQAFSQTDNIMDAMAMIENIGETPGGIIDANKRAYGDYGARVGQLGAGLSSAQARDVVNYKNAKVGGYSGPGLGTITDSLPITQAKAMSSARRVARVDVDQSLELVKVMSNIENTLMTFAGPDGVGMKIVKAVDKMVDMIRRLVGP